MDLDRAVHESSRPGAQRALLAASIATVALAAATLVVQLVESSTRVVATTAAVAIFIGVVTIFIGIHAARFSRRGLVVLLASVVLVTGSVTLAFAADFRAGDDAAPAPPEIKMVYPLPGSTALVPRCFHAQFEADLPQGYEFVVVDSPENGSMHYYEANVTFDTPSNHWRGEVILKDDPGSTHHLVMIMLEEGWSRYLPSLNPEWDTWWESESHPPNSVELIRFTVRRNNDPGDDC